MNCAAEKGGCGYREADDGGLRGRWKAEGGRGVVPA